MSAASQVAEPNQSTETTTTPGQAEVVDTPPASDQTEQDETTEAPEAEVTDETTADETAESTESETEETTEEHEGAPENYEFAAPPGFPEDFAYDDQVADTLAKVFRELDLTQANAQHLLDTVFPVMNRRGQEQDNAIQAQWMEESKAHPKIGGEKFEQNVALAQKVAEAYGFSELVQGRWGSHAGVIQALMAAGPSVSEDNFVRGEPGGRSVDLDDPDTQADLLFPNSPK